MAAELHEISPKGRKFRQCYLPPQEVAPVVRLFRDGIPIRIIGRRRKRDSAHVQQCVNKYIDTLESENRALREMSDGHGELIARPLHRRGLNSEAIAA